MAEYQEIIISGGSGGGGSSAPPTWDAIEGKPTVFPPDPDLIPDGEYVVPHTWVVPGDVAVPSGDTNVIPPMFANGDHYDISIVSVLCRMSSGTSVSFNVVVGASSVGSFTATTNTLYSDLTYDIVSKSAIAPVVTAVSGSPKNLTITISLKYKKKEV